MYLHVTSMIKFVTLNSVCDLNNKKGYILIGKLSIDVRYIQWSKITLKCIVVEVGK